MNIPPPHRLLAGPDIVSGVVGVFLLKLKLRAELCPQPLTARTAKVPPVNDGPKLKLIVFVPAPAVIEVPVGIVHK